MERVRGGQRLAFHAPLAEPLVQRRDLCARPRHDADAGPVNRRQRKWSSHLGLDLVEGGIDRQHAARGHSLHEAAAHGDKAERIFHAHHRGQACRHVLAEAVADHRYGAQAPRHPLARQGVLDGEQCGLGQPRLGQQGLGLAARGVAFRIEQAEQVEPEQRPQHLAACPQLAGEDSAGCMELGSHAGVLRSLTREHEDRARTRDGFATYDFDGAALAQQARRFGRRFGHDRHPLAESAPPVVQGEGDIV